MNNPTKSGLYLCQIRWHGQTEYAYSIQEYDTETGWGVTDSAEDILWRELPDMTPIPVGSLVITTGAEDSYGDGFDEGHIFKVVDFKDGKYSICLNSDTSDIWHNIETQEIERI